jgi:hypothetical protein
MTCHLCSAVVATLAMAEKNGWDWFTGWMPKTLYFCPRCQEKHPVKIEALRVESRKRPLV